MIRAFILKIVIKLHESVVFSESVHVNEPIKLFKTKKLRFIVI